MVLVRWAEVAAGPEDAPWLPDGQRRRLHGLRVDADRRRFVGARALLRATVAASTEGAEVDDVEVRQRCARCGGDDHGLPRVVVAGRPGPAVSLTHAGALVAVAVGGGRRVGIDLEPLASATDRALGELATWVRTEAVLKAVGLGVDVEPSPVRLDPASGAASVEPGPGRRRATVLRLADVVTDADHLAAVAVEGRHPVTLDVARVTLPRT